MELAIVYIVAGISSRFKGEIKAFAKVTEDETLIEYSLNQALKSDFTKIVFVVGENTEKKFREKFGDNYKGIPIEYCFQEWNKEERDKPWGTVDASCSAKDVLNCPFVLCNGDDIYGENSFKILVDYLKNNTENATLGYKLKTVLPEENFVNRGIFKIDENNYISDIKEELGISFSNLEERGVKKEDLCSMTIFAFQPYVIARLNERLEMFKKMNKGNRKIECLLPTEINNLIKKENLRIKVYPTQDKWFGITHPGDDLKIKNQLKNK